MLQKTINKIIESKINHWIETIDDKDLQKVILNNVVVTGGCFASMILNDEINDFDCYFKTKESLIAVAKYYADYANKLGLFTQEISIIDCDLCKDTQNDCGYIYNDEFDRGRVKAFIKSSGIVTRNIENDDNENDDIKEKEAEEKHIKKYEPVFFSENAITLEGKIQIVLRFYGDPEEIHKNYDFEHTKSYWTNETKSVISNTAYDCIINKHLIYTGSKYPVCSLFRIRKFLKRGWDINAGQILKISIQISELDFLNINVLHDQLIGVDSSYFNTILKQFEEQKEKNKEFKLTNSYVVEIINKIF